MNIAPTILLVPRDLALLEPGLGGYQPALAFRHKDAKADAPWHLGHPTGANFIRALILAWGGNLHQPGVDLVQHHLQDQANTGEPTPWHLIHFGSDPLLPAFNMARCASSMEAGRACYADSEGNPSDRMGRVTYTSSAS